MKIIGLCGSKGSGKDTFADYLVNTEGYIKIAFADYIRNSLKVLFDWDDEKFKQTNKEVDDEYWGVSPRKMMQEMGTEFLREHCNNIISQDFKLYDGTVYKSTFHIKRLNYDINKFYQNCGNTEALKIIISDIRFQDELDYVKNLGGTIINIDRPTKEKNDFSNHSSETQKLNNIDIHLINDNDLSHYIKKIRFTVEHIQELLLMNCHDSGV